MKKYEKIITLSYTIIVIVVNIIFKYSIPEKTYMHIHYRDKYMLGVVVGYIIIFPIILIDVIKNKKTDIKSKKNIEENIKKVNQDFLKDITLSSAFLFFSILMVIRFIKSYY